MPKRGRLDIERVVGHLEDLLGHTVATSERLQINEDHDRGRQGA
jgi:hypothetical protein